MSQAKELLTGMSEEIPVHTHPVPDTDTYFVIDPITRKIENTNRKKNVVMQYDHNSERFTFELPRYIDGHNMLECTSVTVNVDNIEVIEPEGDEVVEPRVNSDAPDITDLRAHPNDPEKVICSWLISRNSTQLAGILSFHIEFKCVDSNGNVVYEWSTDDYDEIQIKARKKNGEAAVTKHADLLEQWRTRIFGAGDSVMANIAAEGEAQVAAVKAESETQQEAVELKGAQTLDSIPEDYTEVDAMADEAVRSKGDAIVCEAAGESIILKDSSNDHIRGLKLFGKSEQFTTTGKNLFDIEEDLTWTGTYSKDVSIPAGAYLFTWSSVTRNGNNAPQIRFVTNDKWVQFGISNGSVSLELPKDETRIYIYSNGSSYDNSKDVSATITQLMLSVDGGAYEPYTGGKPSPNPDYPQEIVSVENPTVNVYGKNLMRITQVSGATSVGCDVAVNDDGSVIINGTATKEGSIVLNNKLELPVGEYSIHGERVTVFLRAADNKHLGTYFTDSTVRIDDPTNYLLVCVYANKNQVFENLKTHPMICAATTADSNFETYVDTQLLVLGRTLPGIPVTSGGNYTDSEGQQWICDEVDLERGVYVQRVGIKDFDGSDDEDWGGVSEVTDNMRSWITVQGACRPEFDTANSIMCSQFIPQVSMNKGAFYQNRDRFFFGSGMTLNEWKTHLQSKPLQLIYVHSTPIETPLTAEEIAAFKTLRTNFPNTTILNDAGAWMSVKYNADTKSYVDALKAVKIVDSSTGVVYELKIVDGALIVETVK